MARTWFDDPTLQQQFESEGYAIVRLLEPEEAARNIAQIEAMRPDDAFQPDGTGLNRAHYHCTFLDSSDSYRRQVDQFVRDTFTDPIAAVLPDFNILTSNVYAKHPGVGRIEIHQNWVTTTSVTDTTMTVWCPLTPVGAHNGTLQVVPRSHKILPDISAISAEKYFIDFYDELIDHWLTPIELDAGECVVFDDSLIHWSDDNLSSEFRWGVQIVIVPSDCETAIYYFDETHDPPRFELYAIDKNFFVDYGADDLRVRPPGLKLLGYSEQVNRKISEQEFVALMDNGPAIRKLVYAGTPPWPSAFVPATNCST